MARATRDPRLESRSNRLKLETDKRHFTKIGEGLILVYRRGKGAGTWSVKQGSNSEGYSLQALGQADDFEEADGRNILNFSQASGAAREQAAAMRLANGAILKPLTVSQAAEHYLSVKAAGRGAADAKRIIDVHILPKLGKRPVHELSPAEIRKWHHAVAATPARLRVSKYAITQRFAAAPVTADEKRARKATANRILTVLKALLNQAFKDDLVKDDSAWRKVKPFGKVDEPVTRFLTAEEIRRLLNACAPDLRTLAQGALYTGARFGELAEMRVMDVQLGTAMVYIRPGKNGKGRHVPLTSEAATFFEWQTVGKLGDARVFEKDNGTAWGRSHQCRPLRGACKNGRIEPPISFHDLRHTFGSHLAQAGVDLLSISKLLGHADTRITSRHYAHLCDESLRKAVEALPSLSSLTPCNIVGIDRLK